MIEEKVKEMQTKLMKMKVFFKGGVHFHKVSSFNIIVVYAFIVNPCTCNDAKS